MRACDFGSLAPVRKLASIVLTSGVIMFAATASADAVQRFASPAGTGAACTPDQKCSLQVAVESAANGDEVIADGGVYPEGANTLSATANDLTIRGASATDRPSIQSSSSTAINVTGGNVVLKNLRVNQTTSAGGSSGILLFPTSTAEGLEVTSSGNFACAMFGVSITIRDSLCHATAQGSNAVAVSSFTPGQSFLRNVTAVTTATSSVGVRLTNAGSPGAVSVDARNVIARGTSTDVSASSSGPGTADVALSFSNYSSAVTSVGATVTPAGTSNNIAAPALFVDLQLADFHQRPTSPTVNAGAVDGLTGTADFEGDARVLGAAIDIGADELAPVVTPPTGEPPPVVPLPVAGDNAPPQTSIDKGPKKVSNSKNATFTFGADEVGASFECKLDKQAFEACGSPADYKRLKKGEHTFKVRAEDAAGNVDASPATYDWKVKKNPEKPKGKGD